MKIKNLICIIVCIIAVHFRAVAAFDMFLEIDGIAGESHDRGHANTIDVLAFSWGMSNSAATVSGGGGGVGKVQMQDFAVTKTIDKSTAPLMQACASGKHIKKAVLYLRKAGGKAFDYFKITMEDVLVSSVSLGGSSENERPTESLSLNFAKVTVEYTPMNGKSGEGSDLPFEWDLNQSQTN
jgi:type VI secretion system secreted protein Hcp